MASLTRGSIPPILSSDEDIQSIPWPHGKGRIPGGPPVQQINFNQGQAWDGPTGRDIPSVPRPIQKPESIPVPANLPEIQSVSPEMNINFIARLLASVLIQPRSFITGNMTCAVVNRGYQLPDILIPAMQQVVVKSWFTNTGVIYIAYRQSDAQSAAVAWPLIANEGMGYRIPNVNGIWIMATVAGEGASYTVEQA